MKTIKVKSKDDQLFLELSDFSDILDTSRVDSYTLEEVDDDGRSALILTFYDKDGNIVETQVGR